MGVIYINGVEQEKQGYLSRFTFQTGLSITGRGQLQRRLDPVDTNIHTHARVCGPHCNALCGARLQQKRNPLLTSMLSGCNGSNYSITPRDKHTQPL